MTEAQVSVSTFAAAFDAQLMLTDGATGYSPPTTITTGAFGQVAGTNKIVDLGVGLVKGYWIVDLQGIDAGAGKQTTVLLYGADTSVFGSTSNALVLAVLIVGDATVNFTNTPLDSQVGRYVIPFTNCPFRASGAAPTVGVTNNPFNGLCKRFVRTIHLSTAGAAPTASSFDYMSYLTVEA